MEQAKCLTFKEDLRLVQPNYSMVYTILRTSLPKFGVFNLKF